EKDRDEEEAEHLGRRRIWEIGAPTPIRRRRAVPRGDREDPVGAEMDGRRKRLRQADADVAVPYAVDADREKEEWEGGRGHDVVHSEGRRHAAAPWPGP